MPICIGCGCTDNRACVTSDGPCHWVKRKPPVCSACEDTVLRRFPMRRRVRLTEAGRAGNIVPKKHRDRTGIIVGYQHRSPRVLWRGRRTADSYAPEFIELAPTRGRAS